MSRHHSAVNDGAPAPVPKLKVASRGNFPSQQIDGQADRLVKEMSRLSNAAFDRRYAANELGYEGP